MTRDARGAGQPRRHRIVDVLRRLLWPAVAAAAALAFALGFLGFVRFFDAAGQQYSVWDILYRDLQLFTVESGSVSGPVPWPLQVARFLAPVVTMVTAITAIAALLRDRLRIARLRYWRDHTVVCGLGRKGLLLVESLAARGERVVVIESDEQDDYVERCRRRGIPVVFGDAADGGLLRRVRADRARRVVAVCGDDGVNAEVAVHCRDLVRSRRTTPLDCFVHIADAHLCRLLREQELRLTEGEPLRLEFFDVHERGARALLQQFPPFQTNHVRQAGASEATAALPHILVVGCGRMGEELVVQAARAWWREHRGMGERFWVSIVDRQANAKRRVLALRYRRLTEACEVVPVELDIASPEFERADFLGGADDGPPAVTTAYVCLDDDSRGLSAALALLRRMQGSAATIVVRMMEEAGLGSIVAQVRDGGERFANLHAFGVLALVCAPERLFAGTHQTLARAIHEDYLADQRRLGKRPAENPALVGWDELPPDLQQSNFQQADHTVRKLTAVRCDLAPLADWDAEAFAFSSAEIALLAEMEHERWMEERLAAGWVFGSGPKDLGRKTSPFLVPWDELPEDQKEYDRRTVRDLPLFLAGVGLQIVRLPGNEKA
jgi:hypothetical protein